MHPLTNALTMAVNASSAIMHAQYVRVCARAGGLGGGMGVFLLTPLLSAVRVAAEGAAGLVRTGGVDDHEACVYAVKQCRVVLQMMVPLVVRPALKV